MTFQIKITLGNEAMEHGDHIAEALRKVASHVEHIRAGGLPGREDKIRDANGNTVGRWKVTAR